MKNWTFKQWNTILGWFVFAVSFIVYLTTIEPELSFWDAGEYIASSTKLEVTHAPGAALYQLVGAVAAIFAFGDGGNYSVVINAMSALFSAFTVLFLFWTITHLVRRLLNKDFDQVTTHEEISILFSGIIGSLAFAFSDTFWFSAVEGEVYAMAVMFIALLVWLITKWENEYHDEANERWIILIFFVVGLSVGVHMMCMLALPAVCFIYYARNYEFTWKNFFWANVITVGILAFVFKLIFPVIMTLFGKLEIFFVNGIGLPFHSGTIVAFILLITFCYFAIKYARRAKKSIWQTMALSVVYMIIGFSCWMVIPIRALANPPMNLNNPDNAIGMLDYYNREQYGDWPTFYGHNYTAHIDHDGIQTNEDGSLKTSKTGDIYEKDEKSKSYLKVGERFNYVYAPEHISIMPRMFNEDRGVMSNYISMYGAPDFTFNYNSEAADSPEAQKIFEEMRSKYEAGKMKLDDYLDIKPYGIIDVQRPSLADNMDYFFTFQNGYYFVRYLMWNFVGRQNDLEGHQEITNGNWISGIPFIDDAILGDQSKLPAKFNNASTVKFFFLPLLLAIIGFVFQVNRDFGRFYAVLSLFLLTSVGIIFYTGVKPFEPRERDYAMVGSFYATSIWIGLGAAAILWFLQRKIKSNAANIVAGIVLLGIPLMMAFQNYNPHDRSEKTAAYDYSYSALKSLPKDAILFVYGDNDTYPVWGLQETELFRDDVKVVNFTLLATPWNIDQVKRRTYSAKAIPGTLVHEEFRDGTNDQIVVMNPERWKNFIQNQLERGAPESMFQPYVQYIEKDSMTVKEAIQFIRQRNPQKDEILKLLFGEERFEKFNFLPVSKFIIPVNKENAVKSGAITAADLPETVDQITVKYNSGTMFKNNLMMLDLLAHNDWKQSISFSTGGIYDSENIFYLDDYLQYDGFNYRLVPIKTDIRVDGEMGRVDPNSLYNTVKNYKWGNFKNLKNHYDETATSNIAGYRNAAARGAQALAAVGQNGKAVELLQLSEKEIPYSRYNDPKTLSNTVYAYIVAGQEQKAITLAEDLKKAIFEEYDYYRSLPADKRRFLGSQMRLKPREYALIVAAVSDAYNKTGRPQKGYDYLVKSLSPVDKRFNDWIDDLETMGKEKAYREAERAQEITPFYSMLFDVMEPYDSTYAKEKENEITQAIMRVAQ